jgi:hypothetical protein
MLCAAADIFSLGTILYEIFAKSIAAHDIAYTGSPEEFQIYATRVRVLCMHPAACLYCRAKLTHLSPCFQASSARLLRTAWCFLRRWLVGTGELSLHVMYMLVRCAVHDDHVHICAANPCKT